MRKSLPEGTPKISNNKSLLSRAFIISHKFEAKEHNEHYENFRYEAIITPTNRLLEQLGIENEVITIPFKAFEWRIEELPLSAELKQKLRVF